MPDPFSRRMLAIAFGPSTMRAAVEGLPRIREQADCVELRLDLFDEPFDTAGLLRARGDLPAIITLRPPRQGGRSEMTPAQQLDVLCEAAERGAEYVDLEFDAASPAAIDRLHAAGAQVVVSRHDFSTMPDLRRWWSELATLGGDVVKVVGTARDARDCLHVFRALEDADRPTVAIAMGQSGLASRVLALRYDRCLLTYAALDAGIETAPGQLTAKDMRDVYRVARLTATTRVYGLLGPHNEHERLAEYNAWFAADGFDAVAVPINASADAAAIVAAYRELPVSGWHIHGSSLQTEVLQVLDAVTPSASRQGKANAVVRQTDGTLAGSWVESPREQYEVWRSGTP